MPADADYKTEQEAFWAGEFGNDYISRNNAIDLIAANLALFSEIITHTQGINSIIEFGANIGLNLRALRQLLPNARMSAIEINATATKELRALGYVDAQNKSILEYTPPTTYDFVLIKGVLIHINPDILSSVYDVLYASSSRYICMVEYYNPSPVTVPYRNHKDRLYKRDFAGEIMDRYKDLKLADYGFKYHRDPNFQYGDETWFLLEK